MYLFVLCQMMTHMKSIVVFSDLDGTLLDHDTYGWDAAQPILDHLAAINAPVILATSKTAAEVLPLQDQMGLSGLPAIVENGAGLVGLDGADAAANDYAKLRTCLDRVPHPLRSHFTGFGDLSVDQVADITGLTKSAAKGAKTRAFSEPGLWSGTDADKDTFIETLLKIGVHARMGGRFLTLSFGKTKKDRMADVSAHFAPDLTVALGDAPNDIEMLEMADYGFIINNPHHTALPPLAGETDGRILRTHASGPHGWAEAMTGFLSRHDLPKKGEDIG